jgi:Spy/CpxP family protein refolding chaperone
LLKFEHLTSFSRKKLRWHLYLGRHTIGRIILAFVGNREFVMVRLAFVFMLLATSSAVAQSPYAGMQSRPVKALSDQQVADLKAGRGMGMALPAELNGYPGPLHVLDLAEKLELTPDQKERIQALFSSMQREAIPLGIKLIEQEAALDELFAIRTVTPKSLKAMTAAIAQTQGALRETHLKYHLTTVAVLTDEQRLRYGEFRGYGGVSQHHHWRH